VKKSARRADWRAESIAIETYVRPDAEPQPVSGFECVGGLTGIVQCNAYVRQTISATYLAASFQPHLVIGHR
jgi:hypothetical protein